LVKFTVFAQYGDSERIDGKSCKLNLFRRVFVCAESFLEVSCEAFVETHFSGQSVLRAIAPVVVNGLGYGCVLSHGQPAFVLGFSTQQGVENSVSTRESCGIRAVYGHEGVEGGLWGSRDERVRCGHGEACLRVSVRAGEHNRQHGDGCQEYKRNETVCTRSCHVPKVANILLLWAAWACVVLRREFILPARP